MFSQFIEKSKGIAISEITSAERFWPRAGAKKGISIKRRVLDLSLKLRILLSVVLNKNIVQSKWWEEQKSKY